jgi:hypothetical protein
VCPLEKGSKFPQCSRTDEIEGSNLFSQLLIAANEDPSACKSKVTNDFRKKGRLFDVGLDEENLQLGPDDFEWQTRKTGSRTHVGEPTMLHRDR